MAFGGVMFPRLRVRLGGWLVLFGRGVVPLRPIFLG